MGKPPKGSAFPASINKVQDQHIIYKHQKIFHQQPHQQGEFAMPVSK
jgi:hypothetical protein